MSTQMIVRLDPKLKNQLQRLARAEGKSSSQVVRELVQNYVADRDIQGAIAHLWDRIGSQLVGAQADPADVPAVIAAARAAAR